MAAGYWTAQLRIADGDAGEEAPEIAYAERYDLQGRPARLFVLAEPCRPGAERFIEELVNRTGEDFLSAEGSLTGILQRVLRDRHDEVRDWNRTNLPRDQVSYGLSCLVLREDQGFLAQLGPSLAYVRRGSTVERLQPTDKRSARPLGVAEIVAPQFTRMDLRGGDLIVLISSTAADSIADEMAARLQGRSPDDVLRALYPLLRTLPYAATMVVAPVPAHAAAAAEDAQAPHASDAAEATQPAAAAAPATQPPPPEPAAVDTAAAVKPGDEAAPLESGPPGIAVEPIAPPSAEAIEAAAAPPPQGPVARAILGGGRFLRHAVQRRLGWERSDPWNDPWAEMGPDDEARGKMEPPRAERAAAEPEMRAEALVERSAPPPSRGRPPPDFAIGEAGAAAGEGYGLRPWDLAPPPFAPRRFDIPEPAGGDDAAEADEVVPPEFEWEDSDAEEVAAIDPRPSGLEPGEAQPDDDTAGAPPEPGSPPGVQAKPTATDAGDEEPSRAAAAAEAAQSEQSTPSAHPTSAPAPAPAPETADTSDLREASEPDATAPRAAPDFEGGPAARPEEPEGEAERPPGRLVDPSPDDSDAPSARSKSDVATMTLVREEAVEAVAGDGGVENAAVFDMDVLERQPALAEGWPRNPFTPQPPPVLESRVNLDGVANPSPLFSLRAVAPNLRRRRPVREGTPAAGGPAWRRGWAPVALILGGALLVLVVVAGALLIPDLIQESEGSRVDESLAEARLRFRGASLAEEPAVIRDELVLAAASVQAALDAQPLHEEALAFAAEVEDALRLVNLIVQPADVGVALDFRDVIAPPFALATAQVGGDAVYVLDESGGRIFAVAIEGGDPQTIFRAGEQYNVVGRFGGPAAAEPISMEWAKSAGGLVILDAERHLYRYDPASGVAALDVPDPEALGSADAVAVEGSAVYLLDSVGGSVWRYELEPDGTLSSGTTVVTRTDLTGANSLVVAGAIFVATDEGRIRRFFDGEEQPFPEVGLDRPLLLAASLTLGTESGLLYAVDRGNNRVVVFNPAGELVAQIRADLLRDVRGVVADEAQGRLYYVNADALLTSSLPTLPLLSAP